MSESIPILILIFVTVVLAAYTFFGIRWWVAQQEKMSKMSNWINLIMPLVIIAFVIIGPMCLLMLSIDELKSWKGVDIGGNGRFFALFGWIVPTGIYGIIYIIRKNKSGRK